MTVIRWCDSGHLPCIKIGVLRRIREEDLVCILKTERGPQRLKAPEPVYNGPSAEELGFYSEEDEVFRQQELSKLCADAGIQIEAMKAKKASTPPPATKLFHDYLKKQSTGKVLSKYKSGFDTFSCMLKCGFCGSNLSRRRLRWDYTSKVGMAVRGGNGKR